MRASVNGTVLADSDETVVVEGNHYFPPESVRMEHLAPSTHQTVCPWKGTASYYDVRVDDETLSDAAWYYPNPKPDAEHIRNHVAYYKSKVSIED